MRSVTGVPGGDVRVRVHRVYVPVGARWIGQILLADEHERRLGHPPAVKQLLPGGDLPQPTAHVHGASPSHGLMRPRNAAVDRGSRGP